MAVLVTYPNPNYISMRNASAKGSSTGADM